MVIYTFIVVWAIALLAIKSKPLKNEYGLQDTYYGRKASFKRLFVAFLPLLFFSALRSTGIADTGNYIGNYENLSTTFSFPEGYDRFGFLLIEKFCKSFISTDPRFWLAVMSLLLFIPFAKCMSRYCIDVEVMAIVYFLSVSFFDYFNGCRQGIATSVCLYCIRYLDEKKYFKYIIGIILASTIHSSCLVMFALLILYNVEPWQKTMLLATVVTVVFAVTSSTTLIPLLETVIENTQYSTYIGNLNSAGINIFRVLVSYVPPVICFIYRNRIKSLNNKMINLFVNVSVINALILTLGMFVTALLLGRIASYFGIFSTLLYPIIFRIVLPPKNSKSIFIIFFIGYILFFIYQMYFTWSDLLYISETLGISI